MAEVATYDLIYHYGDSFNGPSWQWQDAAGNPQVTTGYLASMKVKDSSGVQRLLLDSSGGASGLSIPSNGTIVPNATPAKMTSGSLVEGESYKYDIQFKSSDGSIIKTLTKGIFRVDKQVTDV